MTGHTETVIETAQPRILQLDALRGLLAIAIMVYHLLSWNGVAVVYPLGTYGVYAFFVLSGFALEYVYGERLRMNGGLQRYAVARFARIFPLYAVVSLLATLLLVAHGVPPSVSDVVLNVGLLFGFVNPGSTSIVTGGWSIGIEVVFYVVFPLLVLLTRSWRSLLVAVAAGLAIRMVYVGAIWPDGASLASVWTAYSQFPAFAAFFIGGMGIARLVRWSDLRLPGIAALGAALLVMAVLVAVALPLSDRALMTGWTGLALTIGCLAVIAAAAFGRPLHGRGAAVAGFLGDISYATYLVHPIVWGTLLLVGVGGARRTLLTLALTPVVALLVHAAIEVPAGRWIRRNIGTDPRRRPVTPASAGPTTA